jgi:hypothetical protein
MNIARRVREQGAEFVATGNVLLDAITGRLDDPTGAYNIALKDNLTALSEADNWKEARKEWRATGNVWYVPMNDDAEDVLPSPHNQSHPHYCICGHSIAWHFEIENTENNRIEIVGSEHIGFWMIVRHLIENLEIPEDEVTEERVKEWVLEAVNSMKSEWWWKENGEEFEKMFEVIREVDLFINTRQGKPYQDYDTARTEYAKLIRKKAEGKMGTPLYLMASIVWRWNHPDNTKAQINTRGYPNDRLWNDLLIFYFNIDKHKETINVASVEREERLAEIKQRKEVEEAERVEREKEQKIQHRKRRIEAQKRLEKERKEIALRIPNFCEKHNIPVFTAESHGNNDWEISFLVDMIGKIHSGNFMSEKQLLRTIKIVKGEEDMATENQLSYIRKLGGTPNADLTKRDASQMIDELKNPSGEEE